MFQIYYNYDQNGPGKVLKNLISGLKQCNEEFELNTTPRENTKIICLQDHPILHSKYINNMIIGPNICTLPIDNHVVMQHQYKKLLVPCEWVKNLYSKWIPEEKLIIWPVGVDTESFIDLSDLKKPNDCLLYIKRRDQKDIEYVISLLKKYKQKYVLVEYGNFKKNSFISNL